MSTMIYSIHRITVSYLCNTCVLLIFCCMLHNDHCVLLEFVSCSLFIMFCSCLCFAHCLCFVYVCYILLTAQYVLLMFSICCSLLGMGCLRLYVALCVLLYIARCSVSVAQECKLLGALHLLLRLVHCLLLLYWQSNAEWSYKKFEILLRDWHSTLLS